MQQAELDELRENSIANEEKVAVLDSTIVILNSNLKEAEKRIPPSVAAKQLEENEGKWRKKVGILSSPFLQLFKKSFLCLQFSWMMFKLN
mgnify:CR=1 FL=1